jgi:hypothetical protein
MFNSIHFAQFEKWRGDNYLHEMGGVTSGPIAVFRYFCLIAASWGGLLIGVSLLVAILKIVNTTLDVAMLSFYIFLIVWLCFSFTRSYSQLINNIVDFFERGILPQGIGLFGQPVVSIIPPQLIPSISRFIQVPKSPPRFC